MEKAPSESAYLAWALTELGRLLGEQGKLDEAETYLRRGVVISEKLAPDSTETANSLQALGDVLRQRGDTLHAKEYFMKALSIRQRLVPDTADHAESLAALASVLREEQRPAEAAPLYERALNALERQIARSGGSEEGRSSFRAGHAAYYKDYIDLLMAQQQTGLAFQVLERFHARTLLETLAAGHVDIRKDVDAALVERERGLQKSLRGKNQRSFATHGRSARGKTTGRSQSSD
jgi:tetratricopeptide (TPR) repeat protein